MRFTATQVRENWGQEGLDVVNDLMRVHGTEILPDPVRDETLKFLAGGHNILIMLFQDPPPEAIARRTGATN